MKNQKKIRYLVICCLIFIYIFSVSIIIKEKLYENSFYELNEYEKILRTFLPISMASNTIISCGVLITLDKK